MDELQRKKDMCLCVNCRMNRLEESLKSMDRAITKLTPGKASDGAKSLNELNFLNFIQ